MDPTGLDGSWPGLPPGRCPRCLHRLEWCLCAEIPRLVTRTRIVIVRQHAERFRSSNTGRLAHLALATSALCDVGGPARRDLDGLDEPDAWLLFPEGAPCTTAPAPPPSTVIAIDASWHQARRMRQRLQPLRGRRILALAPTPATARMRKAPVATHVSTIEAIAGVLRLLGEPDAADALDRLFALAIERQLRSGRQPHGTTDAGD
ncbi:MAG TPA: tRNA-uridine aminocarboxypropyltransferase [Kofleriaceae bacterium]|nr:tRNA-uridine aminocarboxypropyltransferase [Kofleriaceae bacterium]